MTWSGMLIGHAEEGNGPSAARLTLMLGDREGPVGHSWADSLASTSSGVAPFLVTLRPGVPVRPLAILVPAVASAGPEHDDLVRGAAHAGVAAGIHDALTRGVVPLSIADQAVMVIKAWVDPIGVPRAPGRRVSQQPHRRTGGDPKRTTRTPGHRRPRGVFRSGGQRVLHSVIDPDRRGGGRPGPGPPAP